MNSGHRVLRFCIHCLKSIIFLLFIHLLTSCTKEQPGGDWIIEVETGFSLAPANFGAAITRADVTADVDAVKNLWILQFDGTSDASKLVKSEYKNSVDNLADVKIILIKGSNQRVVFIANTFDSTLFNEEKASPGVYSFSQFKKKKFSISDESGMFTGSGEKFMRMYGSYDEDVPSKDASVLLYRIGAKVILTYTSDDVSSVPDGSRFRVTSVQLKDVPDSSSYISDPLNTVVATPAYVVNYPVTSGSATGVSGEAYSINDYDGFVSYYLPENIRGVNLSVGTQQQKPLFAPVNSTWIEIKGEGIGSDDRVNEYVTFKLYLGNNLTTNYNINNNTEYTINLKFKGINLKDARLKVERISDIEIFQEEIIEWENLQNH